MTAVAARGAREAIPAVIADVRLRIALGVTPAAVAVAATELAEAVGVRQTIPWHSVPVEYTRLFGA